MIKLIYIHGEFGQVARPDGKRYRTTDTNHNGEEVYSSKEEAIKIAKDYVKKYPLNCCHIFAEDNNCEEIHGDEQMYFKALEEKKKERMEMGNQLQIKSRIFNTSFYVVLIVIIYLFVR